MYYTVKKLLFQWNQDCFHSLSDILPVGGFHVTLFYHRVMKGGIDLLMTQKPLYLLNRHAFADGRGCHGPPEFVRMHVMDIAWNTATAE